MNRDRRNAGSRAPSQTQLARERLRSFVCLNGRQLGNQAIPVESATVYMRDPLGTHDSGKTGLPTHPVLPFFGLQKLPKSFY